MPDQNTWRTKQEIAAHLRISTRTLDRYVAEGKIPVHRLGARMIRYRLEDADAFVAGALSTEAAGDRASIEKPFRVVTAPTARGPKRRSA